MNFDGSDLVLEVSIQNQDQEVDWTHSRFNSKSLLVKELWRNSIELN